MITLIPNILNFILMIAFTYFALRLYRLIPSPSIKWLVLSGWFAIALRLSMLITGIRIIPFNYELSKCLSLVFFFLLTVGIYGVYVAVKKYLKK